MDFWFSNFLFSFSLYIIFIALLTKTNHGPEKKLNGIMVFFAGWNGSPRS